VRAYRLRQFGIGVLVTFVALLVPVIICGSTHCCLPELPDCPMTPTPSVMGSPQLIRDVVYDQQEGVDLSMDLLIPTRTDGIGVPVLFYPSAGGHGIPQNALTEAALGRGFAIACGSVRYFEVESKFPDALVDAKSAVRYLKAHASEFAIDPDRIVACGSSKNGMFASMLGTMGEMTMYDLGANLHVSSRVAAVINFAGHTDLTAFYSDGINDPQIRMDDATYAAKTMQFLGCHSFACDDIERAASAISYVDSADAPEMLVLGSEDTLVPAAQMVRFRDALLASCVPAYFLVVEGAPHGVVRLLDEAVLNRLLAFLEMVVGP